MTGVVETQRTQVGAVGVFASAHVGSRSLIRMAAVSPADSDDSVDRALKECTYEDIPAVEHWSPADPERRYSVAQFHDPKFGEVEVFRGHLDTVIEESFYKRAERALIRRNAHDQEELGRRCLGVAYRPLGSLEPPRFIGIISLAIGAKSRLLVDHRRAGGRARIDVWPRALRVQHWLNFSFIILLTATGYYLMDPFFGPNPNDDVGFLMGNIRFIHIAAAVCWTAVALWRMSLFFVARHRTMQWHTLWPVYSVQDMRNFIGQVRHYLFIDRDAPLYLGHNPLQQCAYTTVYVLCAIQIVTGFALFGLSEQHSWFWQMMSFLVHLIGITMVRLIHAKIMFLIWVFAFVHVYFVFRSDVLEKSGETSSMVNGSVWVKRGSKPVDGPEIE